MGFRNYSPGLNRFLTRDMYNGALSNLRLSTDPFTMNRYAFAGGNPISNVELDGHRYMIAAGGGSTSSSSGDSDGSSGSFIGTYSGFSAYESLASGISDFYAGEWDTATSTAEGISYTVQHPKESARSLYKLATSFEYASKVWEATKAKASRYATKHSVAQTAGRVVSGVALSFLGGKGILKATKVSKFSKVPNFPDNPDSFKPKGLVRRDYKKGEIVKWHDPTSNKALFEWNSDTRYGNHFHITPDGKNRLVHPETKDTHMWPGDPIPSDFLNFFIRD